MEENTNKNISEKTATEKAAKPVDKRMPRWLARTLKTAAWTVGSVVALLVVVLCLTVWILTPDRLTPIAERLANENLNADT